MKGMWMTMKDVMNKQQEFDSKLDKEGLASVVTTLDDYPTLKQYTHRVHKPERPVLGREREMNSVLASLSRPEVSNAFLVGDPGSGKTMLVQGVANKDSDRIYLEVDLAKMASSDHAGEDGSLQMGVRVKQLFNEAEQYRNDMLRREELEPKFKAKELVLFMDEFHLIIQLSQSATQAIKPALAQSGVRGIKVIAATTYDEFHEFVSKDQALVERLQRINISAPTKDVTISILKSIARTYGVDQFISDPTIYELIVDYSNRYIPANSQPRKSVLLLDAMIGWHRAFKRKLDRSLLADVVYESSGVQVTFKVDARAIQKRLNQRVLSQKFAVSMIEQRLQIAVADLHDKTKPMSSFLFTGSTGVGKALPNDEFIPVHMDDGQTLYKQNGDLKVGDYVYNRLGEPTKVSGVFPQGKQRAYKVVLTDGREIIANDEHLWTYQTKSQRNKGSLNWQTKTLRELMDDGLTYEHSGRDEVKFWIPMNEPVQRPELKIKDMVDPYVLGAMIGNGLLNDDTFTISSGDKNIVDEVGRLVGAESWVKNSNNYNWVFATGEPHGSLVGRMKTRDVFKVIPEITGKKANAMFIPEVYKGGSIEQRWALIQGLFDTDGSIENDTYRCGVRYSTTSKALAYDLQEVLYSLGVSSTVKMYSREGNSDEYDVRVHIENENKHKFFRASVHKVEAAEKAKTVVKQREKKFTHVGIREVVDLGIDVDMTCIMIDDEEHLYQAGKNYIVTHNTEMAKALADLLFDDERSLIRFDMSEYGNADSLDRFRHEVTMQVWNRSHSIVLFDEVEKADPSITRLLLQVLDDGRLTDENGRIVSFANTYIILTTNAGSEIYKSIASYLKEDENDPDGSKNAGMADYDKVIRSSLIADSVFSPELINRVDKIIPFRPLSAETHERIMKKRLSELVQTVYDKHGVSLTIANDVPEYLIFEGLDDSTDAGGARGLMSRLTVEVTSAVARYINLHPDVKNIGITVAGKMAYRDKEKLRSDARILVGTVRPKN